MLFLGEFPLIVYRIIFATELLEFVDDNHATQEEYTKNLDEARELVLQSVIEQFGESALSKSSRMLNTIQKHKYVLDILKIPFDNCTTSSTHSEPDPNRDKET